MTPKFLFNSGQNYRLLYGLWFPSLPFKTHHLFPPKWHWFTRAHCLVLPQASTSDLLTSLAIADLVAGLLAVPLFIIVADPRQKILPGVLYDCVDMFAGKSSMFTLAVISLERLPAIARPLRRRQVTLGHYTIAIVTPWILSLLSHQLRCCYISLSWQRRSSSPLLPSAYQRQCWRVLLIASFGESSPKVYIIMKWEHEMTQDYWGHKL